MRRLSTRILLALSLLLCTQPASGSTGSTTSAGAFLTKAVDDFGAREWVELLSTGGLLSGQPRHPSIELITVHAPGCKTGHLILRKQKLADGRQSLLLSAPAPLARKTRRITIYVKHPSQHLILLEYVGGSWKPRRPQSFRITVEDDLASSQENLLAFAVEGFGPYWLLNSNSSIVPASSSTTQDLWASPSLSRDIFRGVLPWVSSILLLVVCWSISRFVHRIERKAGT